MQLELYKRYVTNDDQVILTTMYYPDHGYEFYGVNQTTGEEVYYTRSGKFYNYDKKDPRDIVSKYSDIEIKGSVEYFNIEEDLLKSIERTKTIKKSGDEILKTLIDVIEDLQMRAKLNLEYPGVVDLSDSIYTRAKNIIKTHANTNS